jgi:hypothetical protein
MKSTLMLPVLLAGLCLFTNSCDKPAVAVEAEAVPPPKKPPVAVQHRLDAPAPVTTEPENAVVTEISPQTKAAFLAALEKCKTVAQELKKVANPTPEQMETYNAMWTGLPTNGLPADLKQALADSSALTAEAMPLFRAIMAKTAGPDEIARMKAWGHETNQSREKAILLGAKYGLDFRFMK